MVQQTAHTGAILVFLDGWEAIQIVRDVLKEPCSPFSNLAYAILPLHSQMPRTEQRLVFRPSRPGVRKIVLATNIAETAITIPDVSVSV